MGPAWTCVAHWLALHNTGCREPSRRAGPHIFHKWNPLESSIMVDLFLFFLIFHTQMEASFSPHLSHMESCLLSSSVATDSGLPSYLIPSFLLCFSNHIRNPSSFPYSLNPSFLPYYETSDFLLNDSWYGSSIPKKDQDIYKLVKLDLSKQGETIFFF